jgi:hypothetical protein
MSLRRRRTRRRPRLRVLKAVKAALLRLFLLLLLLTVGTPRWRIFLACMNAGKFLPQPPFPTPRSASYIPPLSCIPRAAPPPAGGEPIAIHSWKLDLIHHPTAGPSCPVLVPAFLHASLPTTTAPLYPRSLPCQAACPTLVSPTPTALSGLSVVPEHPPRCLLQPLADGVCCVQRAVVGLAAAIVSPLLKLLHTVSEPATTWLSGSLGWILQQRAAPDGMVYFFTAIVVLYFAAGVIVIGGAAFLVSGGEAGTYAKLQIPQRCQHDQFLPCKNASSWSCPALQSKLRLGRPPAL